MVAGYRYSVGDLRTGKLTRPDVDLVGGSWSTPLGEPGSIGGEYPLRALSTKQIEAGVKPRPLWPDARSDAAAGKAFLLVEYENAAGDRTALEAGPIWKSKYTDSTGVFGISAAGLGSYFDHRKVIKALVAGEDPSGVSEEYTAKELSLIAKRLVELSQSHVGGSLPIVLPSDAELGGVGTGLETDFIETYPGYELAWIGDKLKSLSERKEGMEIQFVPRRRSDDPRFIEWVMRIGVAANKGLLTQTGSPHAWFTGVPKSDVREIDISSDGTKMAFRQWAAGQGEAEGRPIVKADAWELIEAGFALLEGEVTSTDSADIDTLPSYAGAALDFSQRPIESWTVTVSRDGRPTVGQIRPGDWARFIVRGHTYLPDHDYDMRILSVAGGDSDSVTLTLSERLGEL